MKKIAVLQSNYLPWKGVFDLIHRVDVFVFLEDVQYTEHDWRNRNKIVTGQGVKWLTVPVKHSGRQGQLIREAEIDTRVNWQRKHFNAFLINYGRAPYFKKYRWLIEDLYLEKEWVKISDFNIYATKVIVGELGIKTLFVNSTDLNTTGCKDDKVIEICRKLKGDYYLSGPAAKSYLVPEKFNHNNIQLEYIDYQYPEYRQLHQPFHHHVTVLDLIFNCGPDAPYFIWGWREDADKGMMP